MEIVEWGKKNPVLAIIAVVAVFLVARYVLASSNSSSSTGNGAAAYYQAQAAQAALGDQVQIAQIQAQAQTAQTQIAANVSTTNNAVWATNDKAMNDATQFANAQVAAYNYAAKTNIVNYDNGILFNVASLASEKRNTSASQSSLENLFIPVN